MRCPPRLTSSSNGRRRRPGDRTGAVFAPEPLESRTLWSAAPAAVVAAPAAHVTAAATTVASRELFYNDSVLDGHDPEAWFTDLAAVAPDKQALRPGQAATFANVSSYTNGINGILVEFTDGPAAIDNGQDLVFRTGTVGNPSTWASSPGPDTAILIPPGGGADPVRTTLLMAWARPVAVNTWLQVTIRATANTGLAADDVFYFGNLVGETGMATASGGFQVDAGDYAAVRADLPQIAGPDDLTDFDRDGRVGALDLLTVRRNLMRSLPPLTAPSAAPAVTAAAPSGNTSLALARARLLASRMARGGGTADLAGTTAPDRLVDKLDVLAAAGR